MDDSKPSKSANKREQQALKQLGDKLIELQDAELARLPLNDSLRDAVQQAKRIKAHGALRRQRQLLGKLLRQVDAEPIQQALLQLQQSGVREKQLFAGAERWRDRIVSDGETAIAAFCEQTGASGAVLQELLGELQRAHSDKALKTVRRKIFRTVNEVLVSTRQDDSISS
ncbi:MAG: ribosome biogenesis factor YjgA [Woeseiaceae bacterium]